MGYGSEAGGVAQGMNADATRIRSSGGMRFGERTITAPTGGLLRISAGLKALGVETDKHDDTLRKLHAVAQMTAALLQLNEAYTQTMKALKAREAAKAAAETAAHIAAQDYMGVAIAAGAAATFAVGFAAGYEYGDSTTNHTHKAPDINTTQGQRKVKQYVEEDDADW